MIGMAQNLSYDLGPYPPATRRSVGQIHEYAYRGRSVIVDHVQRYGDSTYSWADWGDSSIELRAGSRSEEHTSELQSRGHLVCRLLLEKKNVNANHEIVL